MHNYYYYYYYYYYYTITNIIVTIVFIIIIFFKKICIVHGIRYLKAHSEGQANIIPHEGHII